VRTSAPHRSGSSSSHGTGHGGTGTHR